MNYFVFKIAVIGGQAGSCCPKTKFGIFYYWCPVSDSVKEMSEMLNMFIIIFWCVEHRIRCSLISLVGFGPFGIVCFQQFVLHLFGISFQSIPASYSRSLRHFMMAYGVSIAVEGKYSFGTYKLGTAGFAVSTDKIHPQHHLKFRMLGSFRIFHDSGHYIWHISSILPISDLSGCINFIWSFRTGDY